MGIERYQWPGSTLSRIPFGIFTDEEVYQEEQARIFRGRTWSYLCLEAEIPSPGDFRTTFIGDTPVVVNRARDGTLHAFVNRCAHRGATVRREACGNATEHVCCYHQWCYDQTGKLTGVPFKRGVKGRGGHLQDSPEEPQDRPVDASGMDTQHGGRGLGETPHRPRQGIFGLRHLQPRSLSSAWWKGGIQFQS